MSINEVNELKAEIIKDYFIKFKEQNKWFDFHKNTVYEKLGSKLNIPECKIITCLDDILSTGYQTFVLKNTIGFSSKEVLILTKEKENLYYCFLTKKTYTLEDIKNFIEESKSKVIFEEYIGGLEEVIPLDFKCYLLDGKVKSILVINRNVGRTVAKYFDPDSLQPIPFERIFEHSAYSFYEDKSEAYSPSLRERILLVKNYAENQAVKYINCEGIFLSLDFFITPDSNNQYKVWLGEITPKPGILEWNKLKPNAINYFYEKNTKL